MTKKFLIASISSASALLLGFLVVLCVVLSNGTAPLGCDTAVQQWAYDVRGEKGGLCYWFFRIITEFGHTYFIAILALTIGIIFRFKAEFWFFGATEAVAWGTNELVKICVQRIRPDEAMQWMGESSFSFPSGHSLNVTCMLIFVIFLVVFSPKLKQWVKWLISIVCTCLIALVPISRLILGMHYLTDVIAGVLFGAFFAVMGFLVLCLYKHLKQNKQAQQASQSTT